MVDTNLDESRIIDLIDSALGRFKANRRARESFGDYMDRECRVNAEAAS